MLNFIEIIKVNARNENTVWTLNIPGCQAIVAGANCWGTVKGCLVK